MAYVYEHWRPDTDSCFYVGKGTKKRSTEFRRPNKHYNNVIKRLAGMGLKVEVRIISDGLSDEEAYSFEIERIAYWKELGIPLTNISTGGRGGLTGCIRSEESRKKQSATVSGRTLSPERVKQMREIMQSPERKAFTSKLHMGRKRPEGTGKKISEAVKRSWADPEVRDRHRIGNMSRKPPSEETRAKMRSAKTPEARARISAAVKKQWENPEFRKLVSDTMKRTNEARKAAL